MHISPITKIVIHCSATQNGKQLRTATQTAAQRIDDWHKQRGFQRLAGNYKAFNPHLKHIGYHFVIDTDGTIETGAHVKGYNKRPTQPLRIHQSTTPQRKLYNQSK